MKPSYKIAVIKGDGTGPEVVQQGLRVLKRVSELYTVGFDCIDLPYNGDRYLKTGQTLDKEELEGLRHFDAILLGAIGHPKIKPGIIEKEILLKIRFGLDQYINFRPVTLYREKDCPIKGKTPDDINYVVIRENSGGLYTGMGGVAMSHTPHEVATQIMSYTWHQVSRCIRFAFEHARRRHSTSSPWRGLSQEDRDAGYIAKLTLCGKSNVLTYVFDLWERVMQEIGREYPDIKTESINVDAACIYMVECPEKFDVIVTENLFGDIITDLAAITQGGLGISPGANINPDGVSMFEPIGGTAPAFTGKNQINPLACIGSVALLCEHLGHPLLAKSIHVAMHNTIQEMDSMAAGKMGMSTTEVGNRVCHYLK